MNVHKFEIDGAVYHMRMANFTESWSALKDLGAALKGLSIDSNNNIDIGNLLANLGSKEVEKAESLIIGQTSVQTEDGQTKRVDVVYLNEHRQHYIRILIEGFKFQFGDFFAGGAGGMGSLLTQFMSPTPAP